MIPPVAQPTSKAEVLRGLKMSARSVRKLVHGRLASQIEDLLAEAVEGPGHRGIRSARANDNRSTGDTKAGKLSRRWEEQWGQG